MFALPTVVIHGNEARLEDGSLVTLPAELKSASQFDFYTRIAKPGWNVCPQGYHVYVGVDNNGNRFAVPGLKIIGERNSKKNFYTPFSLTKRQVEDFAMSLTSEADRIQAAKDEELALLIHDLRALSSAIYNAAEGARTAFDYDDMATARNRNETVIATHTMLSIRIDMLDVVANQIAYATADKIPVFKKIDKVVRCFRPKASARSISLYFDGVANYSHTFGPAILELIFYAIVDNAVKYSPDNATVRIWVRDVAQEVVVSIKSQGPFISNKERLTIFDRGTRGAEAIRTGQSGTGIGLSMAKKLTEDYLQGVITVDQDASSTHIQGRAYFETTFDIILPLYRK